MPDREVATGTGHLLARVERGVGVVVLNRPERRNALSPELLAGLAAVLPELEKAEDVGALLLTGAGGAFCAGGDVKAFAERGGVTSRDEPVAGQVAVRQALQHDVVGRLYGFAKPTVAALPGAVAGAGIGLALACDLRVGGPDTVFAAAFARVALSGDYGATWLLSRLAGPSRARRLLFLGERLDAATAAEWGLVDRLLTSAAPDDVVAEGLAVAAGLAAGPRRALASMKANLLDAEALDLASAMDAEVRRHVENGLTDDHREAIRAFVEKRPPRFPGTE